VQGSKQQRASDPATAFGRCDALRSEEIAARDVVAREAQHRIAVDGDDHRLPVQQLQCFTVIAQAQAQARDHAEEFGARLGLATLCVSGGMGMAMAIEI